MRYAAAIILLAWSAGTQAQTLLHPMFQDHAVLQRDRPIPVYGSAVPGATVTVTLAGASASATADADGRWQAALPAQAAGGPYTLTATSSAGAAQHADDVLVGDVFLCTGQSNMQLNLRRAGNGDMEAAAAGDSQVRQLTIDRTASLTTLREFPKPVRWVVEAPQTAGDFSASCFFFARETRARVHVPIGLVVAAWGGTRDRGWLSQASLRALGHDNDALDMLDLYRRDPDAAMHRWDAHWQAWWHGVGQGEPWTGHDMANWAPAPSALGPWVGYPGQAVEGGEPGVGYVGQMWLGTRVTLTPQQAAQAATLDLGRINEEDESWINGKGVGGTSQQPAALHAIPPGVLKPGENIVVTNIFCSWKNCGLSGAPETRAIRFADGASVVLNGPWRFKPAPEGIAPQLPWGPMHGATLQYNGMIAPIGPYAFQGAIWYQGESNIYFARHYQATVAAMMGDWRRQFGTGLPFVIVQIPNYGPPYTRPSESLWSDVREAQRRIVEADPHAALAVTFDVGDARNLHPLNKQEVGRRIAIAGRHVFYGEALPPSGPRVTRATRDGTGVRVGFTDVTGGLTALNGAPNAFEACDAGSCHFVTARIAGDAVLLAAARDTTRIRYCWGDAPVCTLTDASGLPAGPFEIAVAP